MAKEDAVRVVWCRTDQKLPCFHASGTYCGAVSFFDACCMPKELPVSYRGPGDTIPVFFFSCARVMYSFWLGMRGAVPKPNAAWVGLVESFYRHETKASGECTDRHRCEPMETAEQ